MNEPRRLSKRYFVESWAFFAAILDDLRSGGNRLLLAEEGPSPYPSLASRRGDSIEKTPQSDPLSRKAGEG
jgi:hypothetical protein